MALPSETFVQSLDPTAAKPVATTTFPTTDGSSAAVQWMLLTDARTPIGASVFSYGTSNPQAVAAVDPTGAHLTVRTAWISNTPSVNQAGGPWTVIASLAGGGAVTGSVGVTQLSSPWLVSGSVQATQAGAPWSVTGSQWVSGVVSVTQASSPWIVQVACTAGGGSTVTGSVSATQVGAPWSIIGSVGATQTGSWRVYVTGSDGTPVAVDSFSGGALLRVAVYSTPAGGSSPTSVFAIQQGSWQVNATVTGSVGATQLGAPWTVTGSVLATQGGAPWSVLASVSQVSSPWVTIGASNAAVIGAVTGSVGASQLGAPWTVNASVAGQLTATASVVGQVTVTASLIGIPTITGSVNATGSVQATVAGSVQATVIGSVGATQLGSPWTVTGSTGATQLGAPWTVLASVSQVTSPWIVQVACTAGAGNTVTGSVYATQVGAPWSVVGSVAATQAGSWTQRIGDQLGVVEPFNTSSTVLNPNATYVGSWADLQNFAGAIVSIATDRASATDGVRLEYSQNQSSLDYFATYTVPGSGFLALTVTPNARYFRVSYANGTSSQGYFHLQTVLKPAAFAQGQQEVLQVTSPWIVQGTVTGVPTVTGSVRTTPAFKTLGFVQYASAVGSALSYPFEGTNAQVSSSTAAGETGLRLDTTIASFDIGGLLVLIASSGSALGQYRRITGWTAGTSATITVDCAWATNLAPSSGMTYRLLMDGRNASQLWAKTELSSSTSQINLAFSLFDYAQNAVGSAQLPAVTMDTIFIVQNLVRSQYVLQSSYFHGQTQTVEPNGCLGSKIEVLSFAGNFSLWGAVT